MSTIDMPSCSRAEIYNCARDIFWHTKSSVWACRCELLHSTSQLHQAACHLGREESRCDGIAENVLWCELESEVTSEVQDGGFGSGVCESCVLAQRADANTCYGGGGDDTGWVFLGRVLPEQRSESTIPSMF